MPLSQNFLDELRARTVLSALIGGAIKVEKAGREHKACCPFHGEKTPSFTISDEKGFYHCFGCGAHGDAIRWLTDQGGLDFIDAVKELAAAAGMEMPERSPESAQRDARVADARDALEAAQRLFADQLDRTGAVAEYLAGRGVTAADIAAFGIGYARGGTGSLKGQGMAQRVLAEAGLIARRDDGSWREVFHDRITFPIRDARGRLCGFAGRIWPGRRAALGDAPKYVNSPQGPLFDKGRLLFNLDRAQSSARMREEGRLLVCEGYLDVVALARAGIAAAVAPMGTAMTEAQLQLAWRAHHRPLLLFDGDGAGRRAALRAAKLALPPIGPGRELAVALLPEGQDPDDVLAAGGREAVEAVIAEAMGLHDFLFNAAVRGDI